MYRLNPLRAAFVGAGINPKTCQRLQCNPGCFSTFLFAFYVMMGGNPFFVVLLDSSPIWEHKSSRAIPAEAALEVLLAKGVVDPKTSDPTVIIPLSGLFGAEMIFFVQVDEKSLVKIVKKDLFSFFKPDVYSLVNPRTGKTGSGNDKTIPGFFDLSHYNAMLTALSPMLSSASLPSLSGFARGGGGGGAVARGGGGGAVARGGGGGKSAPPASSLRLAETASLHSSISNAFVLLTLLNPLNCLLLVQTKRDKCWGLPGGMVNRGEHPSDAAPREFREETKSECPKLANERFFQWTHSSGALTGFICGNSTAQFSDFKKNFKPSREILNIGFFTVEQVYQMALGLDPMNQMRKCAQESTIAILRHMKLVF
jgi:8-oxo-dGTP pyrophosphatase MutT (NUDIX family)